MNIHNFISIIKRCTPIQWHNWLRTKLFHTRSSSSAQIKLSTAIKEAIPSPYLFPIKTDNPLSLLGDKYQPTKRLHNYLPYYWQHFRDIRHEVRSFLEIGLETDRSLRMWEEFFPNAEIVGIDINPKCKAFEGGRRRIYIGDQSDVTFLKTVIEANQFPFDVIIDDGSHLVQHQMASFNFLLPSMSDHGIYVIEDTGPVVNDSKLAVCKALSKLSSNIMHWPSGVDPSEWTKLGHFDSRASWLDRNIIGLAIYRWMIVVMRGRNPEDNPYLPLSDTDK